ncbi:cytochrome P450 monooxygenase [Pyricularia oryzae Y34]|uniref:Cytochrome P450 monooxygenase n=1 Tax=Pyricularia oryzae (strain Y34) TaxID=1143189 RepID=A0AA97PRZ9_PYRO3|nr:cytochrome P450 monooxygenase [Pyricularia oryzae Y34]
MSALIMLFLSYGLYLLAATVCVLSLVALAELVIPGYSPKVLRVALSKVLNWPNGQGDDGKFLSGIENSARWRAKHGSVYRIWSGMHPEVVLTEPGQLSAVFKDSDKHTKAPANNSGAYMDRLLGKCVGLISGQEWRRVRGVVEGPFGFHAASSPSSSKGIERIVARHFEELARTGRLRNGLIHPAEDLKMLPFWVVCEALYGRLPDRLVRELNSMAPLREGLFRHVMQGGLARFGWAAWLPTAANAEMDEFQRRWTAFNEAAYEFAKAQQQQPSNNSSPHDKLPPIVDMVDKMRAGHITQEHLLQTLDESLYANLDVTTGSLSWNLVFLAANRDVQVRLRAELQAASDQSPQSKEAYLRSDATLLHACVLESSRLKPLAAFSVPQAAPSARTVEGYVVPAQTSFVVDSYAINIHSDTWAPDNAAYRPERFLGKGGGGSELRYKFWRFGFGPRQCMGKYLADNIIRRTLAHVVLGFELGWADEGEDWSRARDMWITHPDFCIRCTKSTQERMTAETGAGPHTEV